MLFRDLTSRRWIIAKGFLFLLIGLISLVLICLLSWDWQVVLLAAIMAWAFCRFYYFAFYVIEKYVDPDFKFSSLYAFLLYLLKSRNTSDDKTQPTDKKTPNTHN